MLKKHEKSPRKTVTLVHLDHSATVSQAHITVYIILKSTVKLFNLKVVNTLQNTVLHITSHNQQRPLQLTLCFNLEIIHVTK